jgi:O-methyltransferase involved in polyketide biosynthesis
VFEQKREWRDVGVRVALEGTPETLLWTLYQRASEARRADAVLRDPKAVEVLAAIDFPFEERFGSGTAGWAQWQALRALCFDRQVARFLADHPDGTVVALGEGLETQFWRVDNGRMDWLSVDLPEAIEVRERLLPATGRQRLLACSALDERWIDEVDVARGVLVTAQGLLMYLPPDDVRRLIATCAERLPGGALVFDAVPRWLSERSRQGGLKTSGGWQAPPWTWWMDKAERRRLAEIPAIAELRRLRMPRGRGALFGYALPLMGAVPGLRSAFLSVSLVRFRGGTSSR